MADSEMPAGNAEQADGGDGRAHAHQQTAVLANISLGNVIANINLAQQNAVANQQAMNQVGATVTGKVVNAVLNIGPLEARSAQDVLSNNELAQTIADLKAALESFSHSTGSGGQ